MQSIEEFFRLKTLRVGATTLEGIAIAKMRTISLGDDTQDIPDFQTIQEKMLKESVTEAVILQPKRGPTQSL